MTARMLAVLLMLGSPAALAQDQGGAAQAAAIPSLTAWHGAWVGTGTVFDQPSTATLIMAPALGGGGTVLDYQLAIGGANPVRFFGHGVYRVDAKRRVTGQWSDSNGALHPLKGRLEGRIWSVVWGTPLTEIGRSTYRLHSDGSLAVSDSTLQDDGSWRVFAELRYTRSPA